MNLFVFGPSLDTMYLNSRKSPKLRIDIIGAIIFHGSEENVSKKKKRDIEISITEKE